MSFYDLLEVHPGSSVSKRYLPLPKNIDPKKPNRQDSPAGFRLCPEGQAHGLRGGLGEGHPAAAR